MLPESVFYFFQQKNSPLSEASPSKMGFASRTCCSIQECWPLIAARNCRISFVLSVFPAPDSPLQRQQEWRSVKAMLHPCQCPSLCLQRDFCLCVSSVIVGRMRPLRMGFQHPKDWLWDKWQNMVPDSFQPRSRFAPCSIWPKLLPEFGYPEQMPSFSQH